MTDDEKKILWQVCAEEIGPASALSSIGGGAPPPQVIQELLEGVVRERDSEGLELLIGVSGRSGNTINARVLESLVWEPWHRSHEDITGIIAANSDRSNVELLIKLTFWIPEYLAWDNEGRSLARKALFGLRGWLEIDEVAKRFHEIAESDSEILSATARRLLDLSPSQE